METLKFSRNTFFTGRNGCMKQSGLEVLAISDNRVMLSPITSKGKTGSCDMVIPNENLGAVIESLQRINGKLSLSDQMQAIVNQAKLVIKELVTAHNGMFVVFNSEDAYNESEDCLNTEFQNLSPCLYISTAFSQNDECYPLKIVIEKHDAELFFVNEFGVGDSIQLAELDDSTTCELADWINENNLIEKAKL